MKIAVVTFDGFNEIDSMVAAHMLNRVQLAGWKAEITCPSETVRSMNGVRITAQRPLEFANEADVVLVGSGRLTRDIIADDAIMSRLRLDPRRQLVGSQCSGALVLARLGLLDSLPACTDLSTRPHLEAAGVRVLEQSFYAADNVATAGGCLSAQYLAAWVIWTLRGRDALRDVSSYVAPVGEREQYVARAVSAVEPVRDACAYSNGGNVDVAQALLAVAGLIFLALGTAHGVLTLRDLVNPRAFTPTDDSVRVAMQNTRLALNPRANFWQAWMGFNLSHSVGVVLVGSGLLFLAWPWFPAFAGSHLVQGAASGVAAVYFVLSLRFWFWGPALGSGVGLACILAAILSA